MSIISMYYTKANIRNMKLPTNAVFLTATLFLILSCKLERKEEASLKPDGKTIYVERCTSCHGIDGKMGFGGAKDITASILSIDRIVNQVTNGKGAMAPYKNLLTPEEIVAVSEYAVSMRKK